MRSTQLYSGNVITGIITTALCCFSHCLSIWVLFTVLIPINRKITHIDVCRACPVQRSMSGIWTSLPVARRYRAQAMVIGVVGWGSVRVCWCWNWGGGGAPSSSISINIVPHSEYLSVCTVVRVVYGLSSTIDTGLSFIDLPEDRCLLSLCHSPVSVVLIKPIFVDQWTSWLSPPLGNSKLDCHGGFSWLKLWR